MTQLRGSVVVTGEQVLPIGAVITIPNELADGVDVFRVDLERNGQALTTRKALRGESVGQRLGFTRFVIPMDWAPGEYRIKLTPTDESLRGVPFFAHQAVGNDPRELLATITGLPGGQAIEWNVDSPATWDFFQSAGETRWMIRGQTPGSPRVVAWLNLDMAPTMPLVRFELGYTFHDENLVAWFAAGNQPAVTFPEIEVIQQTQSIQAVPAPPGSGLWAGGMYTARGVLACVNAAPLGIADEHGIEEAIHDETEPQWATDGSVGEVYARLDAIHWDGFAGPMRKVFSGLSGPLPPPYASARGCRNSDVTRVAGGREAFGPCEDSAAYDHPDLQTIFDGLRRGAMGEALRPIHWFDDDAAPLDLSTRDLKTWHSVPDARFSSDMIGNPGGWWQSGGISGQDEAHISHRYGFTLYRLTGDRIIREVLDGQANALWASLRDYAGQPRSVGRTTNFAASYHTIARDPIWRQRMETLATDKMTALLAAIENTDAHLGVADWRSAPVYFGYADTNPASYMTSISEETEAVIAPFMVGLQILGILAWKQIDESIIPGDLWGRTVKCCETVVRHGWHVDQTPGGAILRMPYAFGWHGGHPITDRTPGRWLIANSEGYLMRGTQSPMALLVLGWSEDDEAKQRAQMLLEVDPVTYRNARWRAIDG